MAVNVSGIQFFRDDFVENVLRVLRTTALPPSLLQLELTESVVMPGYEQSAARMESLRAAGIALSIDDFGTGYSSLSYLQKLPFNSLKIDRSFVQDLGQQRDAYAMIHSLVALAHNLRMSVVAEGIETLDQLRMLSDAGCDEVQGYLLGMPGPRPAILIEQQSAGHAEGVFQALITARNESLLSA